MLILMNISYIIPVGTGKTDFSCSLRRLTGGGITGLRYFWGERRAKQAGVDLRIA